MIFIAGIKGAIIERTRMQNDDVDYNAIIVLIKLIMYIKFCTIVLFKNPRPPVHTVNIIYVYKFIKWLYYEVKKIH